jgi:CRP-like cAMP-binding protein
VRPEHNHQVKDFELLGSIAALSWMTGTQLRRLAAAMTFNDFEQKETIVREAQTSSHVYVLVSGIARLLGIDTSGRRFVVSMISRGLMFNAPRLRPEIDQRFIWDALSRSRVGWIGIDRFIAIVSSGNSDDLSGVLGQLFGRCTGLFGRYPGFLSLDLRQRVAAALLELGEEIGTRDSRGYLLRVPVPARVLGEMTGASRPKVSTVLTEFERKGMIVRDQRRIVILADKLAGFLKLRR